MDKETYKGVSELKKTSYGVFRTKEAGTSIYENSAIVTDGQWQLELPNLILDESSSELNGKCGTCAAEFDVSL